MAPQVPTLRINEIIKKLEKFGIRCESGKGSEQKLIGFKFQSTQLAIYSIGKHQTNREIPKDLLKSILRRFEIPVEDFLNNVEH